MFFSFASYIEGLLTTLGLIVAIGPQNAFVLRQAILRNHIAIICLICILIDIILIVIGVNGLGQILTRSNTLLLTAKYGGALFLFYYGGRCFWSAFKTHSMKIDMKSKTISLDKAVTTTLMLSLLNPHVYLDTCILIGSIGAQLPKAEYNSFILGASTASLLWFAVLAIGARMLIPFFQKPTSWKILDCIIGIVMWAISYSLL